MMSRSLWCLCVVFLFTVLTIAAGAETYPARPLRMVVTSGPGAAPDLVARIIAEPLSKALGRPIAILNLGGAGGAIAMREVAKADPDGYTLLFAVGAALTVLPEIQTNLEYKVGQFVPLGFIGEQPFAIAAASVTPVNSLGELIALSKSELYPLNFATGMRGGFQHLAAEAFQERSAARLSMIYYPGSPQALQDVVAGRVPAILAALPNLVAHVTSGSLKLLAVGSRSRLADFPDVPTLAESFPGFYATGWYVLAAPPGTPDEIADLLRKHTLKIVTDPAIESRLKDIHTYTNPMTADEMTNFIAKEQKVWTDILRKVQSDKR